MSAARRTCWRQTSPQDGPPTTTRHGRNSPSGCRMASGSIGARKSCWTGRFPPVGRSGARSPLPGSRYLLVEFNANGPRLRLSARALAGCDSICDLVPILAHPERYSSCSVETVSAWRELGSVIQVDATTVTLARRRGERARSLVDCRTRPIFSRPIITAARATAMWRQRVTGCCERGGEEQATLLLETNPRAILDDTSIYEVDPLKIRTSIWRSMRRMFGSR